MSPQQPTYSQAIARENARHPSPTPVPFWAAQQALTAIQSELDRLADAELARRLRQRPLSEPSRPCPSARGLSREKDASIVRPFDHLGQRNSLASVATGASALSARSIGAAPSPFSLVSAPRVARIGLTLDVLA